MNTCTASSSSSRTSNSAVHWAHLYANRCLLRYLKSVLPQFGHRYLILRAGATSMLSIHPAPKTYRLSRTTARSPTAT